MLQPLRTCFPALLRVLFVFGFGGIFTLIQKSEVQWEYLVFTQIWPQAACIEINETHGGGKCIMPPGVTSWTIHGLWPSIRGEKGPAYCNDSWPFRPDELKDLQPILEKRWPNMIAGEAVFSFWKHEWTKHGTCATSLPALNSEHGYFASTLQLQNRFNITEMLGSSGIYPSINTSVKLERIRSAIESHTRTFARLLCMETKAKTGQIIAQVEICLDKEFKPIDCDKSKYRSFLHQRQSHAFTRLRRSNTEWDSYPYFPQFTDCKENLPTMYIPIKPFT